MYTTNTWYDWLQKNRKLLLVFLVLSFVVGAVLYVIFSVVLFRISGVSPNPAAFPTSSTTITVSYTHALSNSDASSVKIDSVGVESWKVDGKTLTVKLSRTLTEKESVTLELTSIKDTSNNQRSDSIRLVGAYVDFNALPKDEQALQTTQSNSFDDYALVSLLPITTPDYEIAYTYPDADQTKMPVYITIKSPYPTPDATTSKADRTAYESFIKTNQEAAYKVLIALNGYNPDKYDILYSEPVLGQGISGTYTGVYEEY